ncbi:MAG: 4-aminobutyrate--pyruvate transaminase [Paracoccaceae bacterium]|jgi:4-aminobutyrate--pyruvate transaminase
MSAMSGAATRNPSTIDRRCPKPDSIRAIAAEIRSSPMSHAPNSIEARDAAHHLHAYTDLEAYETRGGLVIERGEGIYVYDNDGRKYLEGLAGLWSVAVGFSEERLADAAYKQMRKLPFYHTFSDKTNGPAAMLAEKLISLAPVPMSKVHFTSSGSEANDVVAKMIWYRSNAMGRPAKKKIIGRIKGYHGVTIASGSITGIPRNHGSFDLPLDRMFHTACPDYRTGAQEGETEADFVVRLAQELEDLILREGPETVAAMYGEPVMGAGGVIVPPDGYWAAIQAVLRKYDVLLVADEVICGFGRTGNWFGSTTYEMTPDVITCSKALSSSYMPISAILVSEAFFRPIAEESHRLGVWGHGFTASGHPVAAAVALENLKIIEEMDLVGNVRRLAPQFQARLAALADHPAAIASRGVGLIGALELVPREKFGAAGAAGAAAALNAGLILRASGDAICFCPPLIITSEQIDEMFDLAHTALDAMMAPA